MWIYQLVSIVTKNTTIFQIPDVVEECCASFIFIINMIHLYFIIIVIHLKSHETLVGKYVFINARRAGNIRDYIKLNNGL